MPVAVDRDGALHERAGLLVLPDGTDVWIDPGADLVRFPESATPPQPSSAHDIVDGTRRRRHIVDDDLIVASLNPVA
jgi:hypothetical protein